MRETSDVGVFIRDEDRQKYFAAIRDQGFEISAVMPPSHYIAMRRGDPPSVRIDLLLPAGDPELDAINKAVVMKPDDVRVRVIPVEHLIATKVIAHCTRAEAQDLSDIQRLYNLGAFSAVKVRHLMECLPEDYVADFDQIMQRIKEATRNGTLGVFERGRRR